jgi:hypothetical protein
MRYYLITSPDRTEHLVQGTSRADALRKHVTPMYMVRPAKAEDVVRILSTPVATTPEAE